MSNPRSTYDLTSCWMHLAHAAEDGFDEESGEYTNSFELDAAIEALTVDTEAKMVGIAVVALRYRAAKEARESEAARIAKLAKSDERTEERLKGLIRMLAVASGQYKAEGLGAKVSVGKSVVQKAEVTDDAALPSLFRAPPKPGAPILKSIKLALEAGTKVAGAVLVEGKRRLVIS